jgi:hypothetical protein
LDSAVTTATSVVSADRRQRPGTRTGVEEELRDRLRVRAAAAVAEREHPPAGPERAGQRRRARVQPIGVVGRDPLPQRDDLGGLVRRRPTHLGQHVRHRVAAAAYRNG